MLRFLAAPGLWADWETDNYEDGGCPLAILNDLCLIKGAGSSCWCVENGDEVAISRAIAAYVSTQSALEGLTYMWAPMDEFLKTGIKISKTPIAACPDQEFGRNFHHDFVATSVQQGLALANLVKDKLKSVPQAKVLDDLINSLRLGYIKSTSLHDKKLVSALLKQGSFLMHPLKYAGCDFILA